MENCCMKFKIAKRAKYIRKLKRATPMPNMTCCADIFKYSADWPGSKPNDLLCRAI